MEKQSRFEQIAEIAAIVFLVVGCYWVLRPFVAAVAWAAILCFSTWPIYNWLKQILSRKQKIWFRMSAESFAATLMTLLIALVLVIPFIILVFSLADDVKRLLQFALGVLHEGLPDPPPWLDDVPWVGNMLASTWSDFAHSGPNLQEAVKHFLSRFQGWFFQRGLSVGHGLVQLCLSVFITFFFYRDGVVAVERIQTAVKRIAGDRTQHLLMIVGHTIDGVVYGILGTALAQGVLAGLGFWIAGVPVPLLLGLLTFLCALIPFGPPLVWIPAAAWLFYQGETWWGFFMVVYGTGVISFVDNLLRPYLISRGSNLPFIMVFLGVLGGVIAFGFIGVFLGPVLLSVGYALLKEWGAAIRRNLKNA